jgi:hypothetical protein
VAGLGDLVVKHQHDFSGIADWNAEAVPGNRFMRPLA